MNEHVYKLIELTGTSATSIEEAVNNALGRAAKIAEPRDIHSPVRL